MRGQQLAVGIDVDPLAGGGLQQRMQILQVVAGRQDRLAAHRRHTNHRGLGDAERADVGGVQGLHHRQIEPAELQRLLQQRLDVGRAAGKKNQGLFHAGIDVVTFIAEHLGVVGICADALEPEQNKCAQADNVGPDHVLAGEDSDAGSLRQHTVLVRRRFEVGRASQRLRRSAEIARGRRRGVPKPVADRCRLLDQGHDARGIEIDVGQRGEHGVQDETARILVHDAKLPGGPGVLRDALDRMEQQILQIGSHGVLAARAFCRGAAVACVGAFGLFALVAEHGLISLTVVKVFR